jgi:4-hydroxy-2-oxoglutarate aldolase
MLIEGIFLPVTTPFHADGRLYLPKLKSNIDRYSRTPAAGLLVLGDAGEPGSLSDAELQSVFSTVAEAAGEEKVLIADVTREGVQVTLELARFVAECGYDAVAIQGPAFTKDETMALEVETYFRTVADQSPLPVIVVSGGARTLGFERIAALATHTNIIGSINEKATAERVERLLALTAGISREVKVTNIFAPVTTRMSRQTISTQNFVAAESLGGGTVTIAPGVPRIKTRTKRVGFQILIGATGSMLEGWNAGATGAVSRLATCAPQACCEVWQAFRDGDPPLAVEKQERIRNVAKLMEGPRGIAAIKYGCDLNGYFGGQPRLPLLPLTEDDRKAIQDALAGMQN